MSRLFLIAALAISSTAMAADIDVTEKNCELGNITSVAMYQGLSPAMTLSKACIAKGYTSSKQWLADKTADGADSAQSMGSQGLEFAKEKGAVAKDVASDLADKGLEKATELKNKLFK